MPAMSQLLPAVLLTVEPITVAVAQLLILRLAQSGDDARQQTLNRLILSQFRWCGRLLCSSLVAWQWSCC